MYEYFSLCDYWQRRIDYKSLCAKIYLSNVQSAVGWNQSFDFTHTDADTCVCNRDTSEKILAPAPVRVVLSLCILYGNGVSAIGGHGIFSGYAVYLERILHGIYVCDTHILSGIHFTGDDARDSCGESDVSLYSLFPHHYFVGNRSAAAAVFQLRVVFRIIFGSRYLGISKTSGQVYFLHLGAENGSGDD